MRASIFCIGLFYKISSQFIDFQHYIKSEQHLKMSKNLTKHLARKHFLRTFAAVKR